MEPATPMETVFVMIVESRQIAPTASQTTSALPALVGALSQKIFML
jgi:hypothetical protein